MPDGNPSGITTQTRWVDYFVTIAPVWLLPALPPPTLLSPPLRKVAPATTLIAVPLSQNTLSVRRRLAPETVALAPTLLFLNVVPSTFMVAPEADAIAPVPVA